MKNKIYLRLIGDVHGMISKQRQCISYKCWGRTYLRLIRKCQYSIQLGDMGFDYKALENVDGGRHLWIGGNHDNYDSIATSPPTGYLGDFGYCQKIPSFPFFFVRGADSIDKNYRIEGRSWWRNEELTYEQGRDAANLYLRTRPEIVISHDCPKVCIDKVMTNPYKVNGSRTGGLLQSMLESWQPRLWLFGHHHTNRVFKIPNVKTLFICLNELSYIDVKENGYLKFLQGR